MRAISSFSHTSLVKIYVVDRCCFPVAFAYILPVGLKIIGLLRKFERLRLVLKIFPRVV